MGGNVESESHDEEEGKGCWQGPNIRPAKEGRVRRLPRVGIVAWVLLQGHSSDEEPCRSWGFGHSWVARHTVLYPGCCYPAVTCLVGERMKDACGTLRQTNK